MENIKLAIVVSEFNYDITYLMLEKAKNHAEFLGVVITYIVKVPGAFDISLFIKELLERDNVDAIVTLGAIIKGETQHDEMIASQASRKILDLSVEYDKPVTLGIIGPGATRAQALARIEEYARRAVDSAVKQVKRLALLKEVQHRGNQPLIIG